MADKRTFLVNQEFDPGEDYDYVFVLMGGHSVYARRKDRGSMEKCDYLCLTHSICATGPDGTSFEIRSKDKIEEMKVRS